MCLWLGELGLGTYVPAARNWMQTGEVLLNATGADLEKHLDVRNPLHKKKILMGIERLRRLDTADPALLPFAPGSGSSGLRFVSHHYCVDWRTFNLF